MIRRETQTCGAPSVSLISLIIIALSGVSVAQTSHEVTFTHEGKTVYGTLATPEGAGPYPTIIINPGSGPNDRDGTLPLTGGNAPCLFPGLLNDTLRPYKQLSEALVDSGYAVLRYDKLEFTYTTPQELGTVTFPKLWLPVESAIDFVKTRSEVDTNHIVLIGHSEGSSMIPYIARSRTDIRALVSIAGPRTPLDSLLAYQLVFIADSCNGNVALAQAQADQILTYFDIIRTNAWNAATPSFAGVPASVWYDYIQVIDSVAINYNQADLPALFVGLELDINVPPPELLRFRNEVHITEDFWSIPDVNHYMTTSDDPDVSATLTDTIIYWLGQNVLTSGVNGYVHEDLTCTIHPNPFNSECSISFNEPHVRLDIVVSNIAGQVLLHEKHTSTGEDFTQKLSMRALPDGVYVIGIIADSGQTTQIVIKQ